MLKSIIIIFITIIVCVCSIVFLIMRNTEEGKLYSMYLQQKSHVQNLVQHGSQLVQKDSAKCPTVANGSQKSKQIDLDDYVLKQDLKPDKICPDLNDYIKKTDVPKYTKCSDLNDYIKKTEVPTCSYDGYVKKSELPDMGQYVHKNKIPACPACPDCNLSTQFAQQPSQSNTTQNSLIDNGYSNNKQNNVQNNVQNKMNDYIIEPTASPSTFTTKDPGTYVNMFMGDGELKTANSFKCNTLSHKLDTCYYY